MKDKERLTIARMYRDKCKGCEKCTEVCAHLVMFHGRAILEQNKCNGCGKCVRVCKFEAIGLVSYKAPY